MWIYFKTKKLTILALMAGLSYFFLIGNTFTSEWDDWQIAFNTKALSAQYNKWGDVIGHHPVESYHFSIKSKKGFTSFPDSLVNLVSKQTIKVKYNEVYVIASPSKLVISRGVSISMTLLSFIFLIVSIGIPIHFYKIISLIKREFIFERKIINLLRWLGLELLIIYIVMVFLLYLYQQIEYTQFSFSEYEIVMKSMDPIWIFLGIVVFLIAEILSKALTIKEEQELTV